MYDDQVDQIVSNKHTDLIFGLIHMFILLFFLVVKFNLDSIYVFYFELILSDQNQKYFYLIIFDSNNIKKIVSAFIF